MGDDQINPLKHSLVNEYLKRNCSGYEIPLKDFIHTLEKDVIARALKISHGNQRVASFILGVKPTTLSEKIKRMKIDQFTKPKSLWELKQRLADIDIQAL